MSRGLTSERKLEIVTKYGNSPKDTGNIAVQIALLTARIKDLTEHLKVNKKDKHTRFGLVKLVGKRRKFSAYFKRVDLEGYKKLISDLGLRG